MATERRAMGGGGRFNEQGWASQKGKWPWGEEQGPTTRELSSAGGGARRLPPIGRPKAAGHVTGLYYRRRSPPPSIITVSFDSALYTHWLPVFPVSYAASSLPCSPAIPILPSAAPPPPPRRPPVPSPPWMVSPRTTPVTRTRPLAGTPSLATRRKRCPSISPNIASSTAAATMPTVTAPTGYSCPNRRIPQRLTLTLLSGTQ